MIIDPNITTYIYSIEPDGDPGLEALRIYAEEKMVGYGIVIYDYDIPEYDIWHMMIDEPMQEKGYGNEALDWVIEYIRTKPFGDSNRVALTCNRNNPVARKLYESKGFSATGTEDEDEIELALLLD